MREPVGKKDKGGAIKKAFGPMGLWSSSFSSKVISDKTLAMNARPRRVCGGGRHPRDCGERSGEGLGHLQLPRRLGLWSKKIDEGSRIGELSVAAYKKGTIAFNKFIEIGNDNLGLNFAPIDTID